MNDSSAPVLVTGGSGFIAGHVISALLAHGRRVRTTARSLDADAVIRAQLARIGTADPGGRLEVVVADLTADDGWSQALSGVEEVLHVASPVVIGAVDDEDAVIRPAREGTLRVLRAAADAGVRRVVLTSAFHAVSWGWTDTEHTFTDDDWSKLDGPGVDAYTKAKTLAERDAWEFAAAHPEMELVALNPVAVLGPVVSDRLSGGNAMVAHLLAGRMNPLPDLWLPIVDVRDVAEAHVLALSAPGAAGRRLLLAGSGGMHLAEVAALLGRELDRPDLADAAGGHGTVKRIDGSSAREILGWMPRPTAETVLDTARSLL
ncbi:NAD-dependent epimerase/dehydratase family protein [Microbacterium sp. NPDC089695]|uniref:NAD-dependent epimerase/dehydratase family protein n=1 Tax=Microbacterium sp. NPDC089695 TaxID=3364198 RepID=UPI0037F31CB4